jgi:hypothetical protein
MRFDLIDKHGALLAAMSGQIALTVSLEIQTTDKAAARHGVLPDPGVHSPTVPLDIARQADIYR